MLDILERRRLLSSSVSAGILTITGTSSANTISVTVSSSGKLKVSESGLSDKYYTQSSITKIVVKASGGNDKITISSSVTKNSELQGGTGNDTIRGGGGVDALLGQDGNDNLEGGSKNDYLDGGKGSDSIDYSSRTSAITAKLEYKTASGSTAKGGGGASGEADSFSSCETLIGGSGSDKLSVASEIDDWDLFVGYHLKIDGMAGNDEISFGPNSWSYFPVAIFEGGDGNDSFLAKSFNEAACYGEGGNDTFKSFVEGPQADFSGGTGRDRYDGGGQTLSGDSDLVMDSDLEELVGYSGVGSVTGNSLDNYIEVSGTRLQIWGGAGNDTFAGGSSDDYLFGQDGNDSIKGGGGDDSIEGGSGKDTLRGEGGNDSLYGGSSSDKLYGGSGNDYLKGDSGRDTLYGESGDDLIHSRDLEVDYLYGGSGTDTAIVNIQVEVYDIVSEIEDYLP